MATKRCGRAPSQLSADQFREAMEHSPIGTALVGIDGEWLWANVALYDLLGYSEEELAALTFQDITHSADLDSDLEKVRALLSGEIRGYQMEKRYRRKDGSLVWVMLTVALIRDGDGAPDYFISKVQDISDRKAAEIERAVLTERLTLATRAGGVGVWEWNIVTGQLIWDARMHELYGVPENVEPTYETFLSRVHERDRDRIEGALADAVTGLRPYDTEFTIDAGAGKERQLRALATVVHEDGRAARMIGTNWDVTEHRRLMQLAEEAARSKSEFLATMSHELRTPLNAIIGFSQLMIDARSEPDIALGGRARHFIELIRDSSGTLLSVVNDVLDYSRIEAGGLELDPHELDLEAVVRGVTELLRADAEKRGLEMSLVLPKTPPPIVVGDAARVRQILFNLLSNAIKFTHQGEVRTVLETSAAAAVGNAPSGLVARFRVEDSGIGIPPAARDRLFRPFSQADQSIAREFGGTGLGLAICERLVHAMHGRIGFDRARQTGSEFWFEIHLPLAAPRDLPGEPERSRRAAPPRIVASRHILLAEDVPTNQQLAVALLERDGHRVDVVADGAAAVQAVRKGRFDIVFMDVQMPVMDGIEATRRIRDMGGAFERLPIVAVTANVMAGDVARYLEAGMTDHVGKPFKLAALSGAIDKWCPPPEVPRAA